MNSHDPLAIVPPPWRTTFISTRTRSEKHITPFTFPSGSLQIDCVPDEPHLQAVAAQLGRHLASETGFTVEVAPAPDTPRLEQSSSRDAQIHLSLVSEEEFTRLLDEYQEFQEQGVNVVEPVTDGDAIRSERPRGPETYTLRIDGQNGIDLRAMDLKGLLRGSQTVRQILGNWKDIEGETESGQEKPQEGEVRLVGSEIPSTIIIDGPQFEWRGCLLDCSRFLELLAYHKMNRFHWHLVDDQGWRLQIDAYPKLIEVGSWRSQEDVSSNPPVRYGGYYTKDDVRDILTTADSLGITVVPEIELPGHSMAALASYPELGCTGGPYEVPFEWGIFEDVYCAGNEKVFTFLETILSEVIDLFPNSPYIHIGGDECPKTRWENCPKCRKRVEDEGLKNFDELQSWFVKRIARFLHSKGKSLVGWDEILEGGLPQTQASGSGMVIVQSWRSLDGAVEAVKAGAMAVCSPTSHCYFDYPLSVTNIKKVYEFDAIPPGFTEEQAKQILGGECNMWSERAPQGTIFSKVYPRMLALTAKLWSGPSVSTKIPFEEYHAMLIERHFPRLKKLGVECGDGMQDDHDSDATE
ncbi:hypothetical protein HK102_012656, partial [Quaeritorhiza haematococci]